jgi:hypothetical protein
VSEKISPNALDCQEDDPQIGETVLKSGTKEKQHIVVIKPEGGHSVLQLVYVETPESDSNN